MAKKPEAEGAELQQQEVHKAPVEKFRRYCIDLFGVTPSTFDGATAGLTGEYSADELKAHIKNWLEKEVET